MDSLLCADYLLRAGVMLVQLMFVSLGASSRNAFDKPRTTKIKNNNWKESFLILEREKSMGGPFRLVAIVDQMQHIKQVLKAHAVKTFHEKRGIHFATRRTLLGHFCHHEKLLDTNRLVNILDDTASLRVTKVSRHT